jgi:hypothetical protein
VQAGAPRSVLAVLAVGCVLSIATSKRTYSAYESAIFPEVQLGPELPAVSRDFVVEVGGLPKAMPLAANVSAQLRVGKQAEPATVALEVLDTRGRVWSQVEVEVRGSKRVALPRFDPPCPEAPCETWWSLRATLRAGGPVTVEAVARAQMAGLSEDQRRTLRLVVEVPRVRPDAR